MIIAFAVLLAIVLSVTTLTALLALCATLYLWRKCKKSQGHVESLTIAVYTLNTDKQVLLAQQPPLFYSKSQGTIH